MELHFERQVVIRDEEKSDADVRNRSRIVDQLKKTQSSFSWDLILQTSDPRDFLYGSFMTDVKLMYGSKARSCVTHVRLIYGCKEQVRLIAGRLMCLRL
jgi:ABC-type dipeptide/oligopeptide/nickel transport system ATPase component